MPHPPSESVCLETAPYLLVDDVVSTAEYYRDKLGFDFNSFFGEPPGFVIVKRNSARIMFRRAPETARPAAQPNDARFHEAFDLYVWVSDVDKLADELRARGADIVSGPYDTDGGSDRREMLVRDANGYVLCFGRVLGWP
jgi:hypothetical protein